MTNPSPQGGETPTEGAKVLAYRFLNWNWAPDAMAKAIDAHARDYQSDAIVRATQENEELKQRLAFAEDAAAKGDKARCIADAQDQYIARLRALLGEAHKLGRELLDMVTDYDELDYGEDGPPFTPCLDELEERLDRLNAELGEGRT